MTPGQHFLDQRWSGAGRKQTYLGERKRIRKIEKKRKEREREREKEKREKRKRKKRERNEREMREK